MGINIFSKLNFKKIAQDNHQRIAQALPGILQSERAIMLARIESGKDVNEAVFKRYKPKYADYRAKRGYRVSPPNLRKSGQMLQAVSSRVLNTLGQITGTVFFNNYAERARGNIDRGRKFFGFTEAQFQRIRDRISKLLKR